MSFPKHCGSARNFSALILEWAIQDRLSLMAAYASCEDAEALELKDEIEKEIKAIRERIKKVRPDKLKVAHQRIDMTSPEFHVRAASGKGEATPTTPDPAP